MLISENSSHKTCRKAQKGQERKCCSGRVGGGRRKVMSCPSTPHLCTAPRRAAPFLLPVPHWQCHSIFGTHDFAGLMLYSELLPPQSPQCSESACSVYTCSVSSAKNFPLKCIILEWESMDFHFHCLTDFTVVLKTSFRVPDNEY